MNRNFIFEGGINTALITLMREVGEAPEVGSRIGRTTELTHVGVTCTDPLDRYTTNPVRKPNLAAQIAETMWVLAGRNDVEWLQRYLPRAAEFSDDGKVWRGGYGPRLRNWGAQHSDTLTDGIDQLEHVVKLLRESPGTRQAVAVIYDPEIDSDPGKDIPCNNWLHFTSRLGKLDLHVTIRSNDLMWGWSGINFFEWSTLLEIVAALVGLEVGSIHFSITSLHLYEQHWAKAAKIAERLSIPAYPSTRFELEPGRWDQFELVVKRWFHVEHLIRCGEANVAEQIDYFPEPMLRSWLRVLRWWWTGEEAHLEPLHGTTIYQAALLGVQPKRGPIHDSPPDGDHAKMTRSWERDPRGIDPVPFDEFVTKLHDEKHAAYGDSWKRRGEMLGIMANIARKVDRLGVNGAGDTATDTAIDLLVYLAKYWIWLTDRAASDFTEAPNDFIRRLGANYNKVVPDAAEKDITDRFANLEDLVKNEVRNRRDFVEGLAIRAYDLARTLWEAEQK